MYEIAKSSGLFLTMFSGLIINTSPEFLFGRTRISFNGPKPCKSLDSDFPHRLWPIEGNPLLPIQDCPVDIYLLLSLHIYIFDIHLLIVGSEL